MTMNTIDALRESAHTVETDDPRAILTWSAATFPGRLALSISFGGGGVAIAHMISQIDRSIPLIFLDTGMHFRETLDYRDLFIERYGLTAITIQPEEDPGPMYATDPDRCCDIRKVQPMRRTLMNFDAWISGLRRDQAQTRAAIEPIEMREVNGRPLVRIHPIATWSRLDVMRYMTEHDLPRHSLLERGYTSIGCWPCTQPAKAGEGERAGRWRGMVKTECGLHELGRRTGGEM